MGERWKRREKDRLSWIWATGVLGALVASASSAQSVSVQPGRVALVDSGGSEVVEIDHGADYVAGGGGVSATLDLRPLDGTTSLFFHAFQAQLLVGGGDREGTLLLRDNNGTITTIELDGATGTLLLGGSGEDGDVVLFQSSGAEAIRVDGATGNVTNRLGGNGLVKGWARINDDGSVLDCYRCNVDSTTQLDDGLYSVDFGPVGSSIHGRPRHAVLDSHDDNQVDAGGISLRDGATSTSIVVQTYGSLSLPGDRAFTLVVY